jgi:hypothetical protein
MPKPLQRKHATVVDDAIRFGSNRSKDKEKQGPSSNSSIGSDKESNEHD